MIRISTIFIAICMVLVAASLGLVLYSVAGISGSESAIVALTALTFLILYNAVSMRLRDRTDVGSQIADLSRGTADLARQVAEFGRRLAAVEGRVVSANSAERRPHPGRGRRDQRTRRAGQAARGLGRQPTRIMLSAAATGRGAVSKPEPTQQTEPQPAASRGARAAASSARSRTAAAAAAGSTALPRATSSNCSPR